MKPLINCKDLRFSVPGKDIIKGIDCELMPEDFMVVLGGNGSGKSTFMKLLNRHYEYTKGHVDIDSESIRNYSAKSIRQKIMTISQSIHESLFTNLTIEENAILIESTYAEIHGDKFKQRQFLKELPDYLAQFNPKLPKIMKSQVSDLSGGEQQILALALYMRAKPKLLLLDEHTSALDPKKADVVMQFVNKIVKEQKIACIMTTHKLDDALKYGNRVVAIRDGQFVFDASGKEKDKLQMNDLLEYCY